MISSTTPSQPQEHFLSKSVFSEMPEELIQSVLQRLTPEALACTARVSNFFQEQSGDERLWKQQFFSQWATTPSVDVHSDINWKDRFKVQSNILNVNFTEYFTDDQPLSVPLPTSPTPYLSLNTVTESHSHVSRTVRHPISIIPPGSDELKPTGLPGCSIRRAQDTDGFHLEFFYLDQNNSVLGNQYLKKVNKDDEIVFFKSWIFGIDFFRTHVEGFSLYESPARFSFDCLEYGSRIKSMRSFEDSAALILEDNQVLYFPVLKNPSSIDVYPMKAEVDYLPDHLHFDRDRILFISPSLELEIFNVKRNTREILDLRSLPGYDSQSRKPDQISASDYDGKRLALGFKNGTALILNIKNKNIENFWTPHLLDVLSLRIFGDACITLGDRRALKYWNLKKINKPYFEELTHMPSTQKNILGWKRANQDPLPDTTLLTFDGKRLLTVTSDGAVKRRDFSNGPQS